MKKIFMLLLLCQQAYSQEEPGAGSWKTWVINSGKEFRLHPPPEKKATDVELKELLQMQKSRDESAIRQIMYWNAGAPGYRWDELARNLTAEGMPPFRLLALIDIAIYDATIAAWDTKYHYKRARPSSLDPYLPGLNSPSYPCERSVAAGAAATILAYAFPQKADSVWKLAEQAGMSRLMAGVQYPSDVKAGMELGKKIGTLVLERASKDGSDAKWKGSVPTKPGLWHGSFPTGVTVGTWKTWVLDSGSQFRPPPPPDFAKDMNELKTFKPTLQSSARAFFYGTQDFWSHETDRKIFEYNLQNNAPRAARVYALKSIVAYDAYVACWDAKYAYWGIRPYQYDTTYQQLLNKPPFPGYPSGHATVSSAVATVLTYLFPADGKHFAQKAWDCAESRFEAGIHFRTDNEVGLDMGRKIGAAIIKRAKADGAEGNGKLAKN